MLFCISIIIPTYQGGRFLEQALQSILSQGYPAVEIIVIDGGSTDNSLEIIKKHEKSLAWWVSEPDGGQSQAINKGFARATGEIITFLSSDDLYLPGALADVAVQYRQKPHAGAIIGAFSFWDTGQPASGAPILPLLKIPSPCDMTLGPPGVYRLHQVATFYTRAALDAVGRSVREDLRYVMDRELLYRICCRFPLTLSDLPYGVFRRHPESKSVAEILPFAREFAQIYLEALTGDPAQDHLRRKMANYRLARGYMKYAQALQRFPQSQLALVRAALSSPALVLSASYWNAYLLKKSK